MSSDKSENSTKATGLFFGDTGEMPMDTRKVMVHLLSGPSLEAKRHSILWPILIRDEAIVRSRLFDLFLELIIDRDLEVAFTRQVESDDIEIPRLLRRAPLTYMDSVLLLFLRLQLMQFEDKGERAAVSTEEMLEYLRTYEKNGNTDQVGFQKRMQSSIDKVKKHSILRKIRNSEDRYEISPTLKLLFSADEAREMIEIYKKFAEGSFRATSPEVVNETSAGDDE